MRESRRFGPSLDLDLEQFFDQVNHDRLVAAIARRAALSVPVGSSRGVSS